MTISKVSIGTMCALIGAIPFVAADVAGGPIVIVGLFIAMGFIVGFIVGAVFLIKFIIRKIKNNSVKEIDKNTSPDINKDAKNIAKKK